MTILTIELRWGR